MADFAPKVATRGSGINYTYTHVYAGSYRVIGSCDNYEIGDRPTEVCDYTLQVYWANSGGGPVLLDSRSGQTQPAVGTNGSGYFSTAGSFTVPPGAAFGPFDLNLVLSETRLDYCGSLLTGSSSLPTAVSSYSLTVAGDAYGEAVLSERLPSTGSAMAVPGALAAGAALLMVPLYRGLRRPSRGA